MKKDKVRSPFTSREREFLRSLSAYAKNNGLLNGYQRKVLYEGGYYNHVFIDRLARINESLAEIEDHLTTDDENYAYEVRIKGYRLFLINKAGQGHATSQYLLGDAYYYGIYGFAEDEDEAAKWFRLAAEQGQDDAMFALGNHLLRPGNDNDGVSDAVRWLEEAVEAQNYAAAYRLSTLYLDAERDEFDAKLGLKYLRLAARNDDTEAQTMLGSLYQQGHHVRRNYKTAISWYNKACKGEDAYAMLCLGICYEFGRGVDVNYQRAFKLYEQASDNGNAYADLKLGCFRRFGKGCEEDDTLAFTKFSEAAENDVTDAHYWLGLCQFYGEGTPQNYGEALVNFEIAAEFDPEAYYWIGELKSQGLGCRKNAKAAFECYLKAVEHDVADAKTALGCAFYFGDGVSTDYVEAAKWLELGVGENDSKAMYLLGMCHLEGDGVVENRKAGLKLLQDSASLGNEAAKQELWEMGFDVPDEIKSDREIHEIGDQLLKMSRVAYQKITAPAGPEQGMRESGKLLRFPHLSTGTLDQVMRDHTENGGGDKF